MESSLREFSLEARKARLLESGTKLFESGKAWDAYARYYGEQAQELPAWAQSLLGKPFTQARVRDVSVSTERHRTTLLGGPARAAARIRFSL
jgi:predicted component of type VI protein secretion system